MLEQIVLELEKAFIKNRDTQKAEEMSRYMRNQFTFFGIQSTPRRKIQADWLKTHQQVIASYSPIHIATELFQKEEREFQLAAIDILVKMQKKLTIEDIPSVENLIMCKSWWDTVDLLATKIIGTLLMNRKELQIHYASKWIQSNHLWLQRTAILFQLKYKDNTDTTLLYNTINLLKDQKDFFIQKAIGWALREYAKTNKEWVNQMVVKLELDGLSKREALKHLH